MHTGYILSSIIQHTSHSLHSTSLLAVFSPLPQGKFTCRLFSSHREMLTFPPDSWYHFHSRAFAHALSSIDNVPFALLLLEYTFLPGMHSFIFPNRIKTSSYLVTHPQYTDSTVWATPESVYLCIWLSLIAISQYPQLDCQYSRAWIVSFLSASSAPNSLSQSMP